MYYVIIWKLTLQRGFKQPNFIFSMQKSEFRFIETKIRFYECKIQLLKRTKAQRSASAKKGSKSKKKR